MPELCTHLERNHPPVHDSGWRRLVAVLGLIILYFFAELIGGWWTGSLALLADAGHMLSDIAALTIALWAAWLVQRPSSSQKTFGYHRAETLAALANAGLLFAVAGGILHEAWERFADPPAILAGPMLAIAVGGLVVNLLALSVLHGGHHQNLNLRGAWLHVLGDTLGSLGAITAAVLIARLGWTWADPLASVLVCVLILFSAARLATDAVGVLMEHAPSNIDVEQVRDFILRVPGVKQVHCLHVWTIASGLRALSAHVVVEDADSGPEFLSALHARLRQAFPIEHLTLQIERTPLPDCPLNDTDSCLAR